MFLDRSPAGERGEWGVAIFFLLLLANERRLFNPAWLVKGGCADVLRTHVLSQRPRVFDAKPPGARLFSGRRETVHGRLRGKTPYKKAISREREEVRETASSGRRPRWRGPAGRHDAMAQVTGGRLWSGSGVWGRRRREASGADFSDEYLSRQVARPKPSLRVASIACGEAWHPP